MRMGVPTPSVPRRRSMEDIAATRHSMDARLDPDDFSDVFGGPPRSVLSHKFPADFTRSSSSSSFYEEIFPPAADSLSKGKKNGGRSLPAFRIPARGDGFYSDVFRLSDEGRRSRQRSRANSKSKSNSSSVLSSEDLSPQRRPVTGDDVALSSFASKLRCQLLTISPSFCFSFSLFLCRFESKLLFYVICYLRSRNFGGM